jgi:hypothetical protein
VSEMPTSQPMVVPLHHQQAELDQLSSWGLNSRASHQV